MKAETHAMLRPSNLTSLLKSTQLASVHRTVSSTVLPVCLFEKTFFDFCFYSFWTFCLKFLLWWHSYKKDQNLFTNLSPNFHVWQDFLPVRTEKNYLADYTISAACASNELYDVVMTTEWRHHLHLLHQLFHVLLTNSTVSCTQHHYHRHLLF